MAIGVSRKDLVRGRHYMILCQLYEELEQMEKAAECLAIARAQAPDLAFLSREEFQRLVAETNLAAMYADAILPEDQDLVDAEIKDACLESVRVAGRGRYPRLDYYAIDDTGNLRHAFICSSYNWRPPPMRELVILLGAVPVLPFVDQSGKILTARFDRVEGLPGYYFGKVSYAEEHRPGTFGSMLAGLPCQECLEISGGEFLLRTRGDLNQSRKHYRLLLSIPRDYSVRNSTAEPTEVRESAGRVVHIFRRKLRSNEAYPDVRVSLQKT